MAALGLVAALGRDSGIGSAGAIEAVAAAGVSAIAAAGSSFDRSRPSSLVVVVVVVSAAFGSIAADHYLHYYTLQLTCNRDFSIGVAEIYRFSFFIKNKNNKKIISVLITCSVTIIIVSKSKNYYYLTCKIIISINK